MLLEVHIVWPHKEPDGWFVFNSEIAPEPRCVIDYPGAVVSTATLRRLLIAAGAMTASNGLVVSDLDMSNAAAIMSTKRGHKPIALVMKP